MQEKLIQIRRINCSLNKERTYSIDVDDTTTFSELKRIIAASAHLLKNNFKIMYDGQEYGDDLNDFTIGQLFYELNPISLQIIWEKDDKSNDFQNLCFRFDMNDIKNVCKEHNKMKMFYCFSCKESICSDCLNGKHKSHQYEEKADFLLPPKYLMEKIFAETYIYKPDAKLSKSLDCIKFRSEVKFNIFANLRKLLDDLEKKCSSCLQFFSENENVSQRNINANIEILKKYCAECFMELIEKKNANGLLLNDENFLMLYHQAKGIENYKDKYLKQNIEKYEKLNALLEPFIAYVRKIAGELMQVLTNSLNNNLYELFQISVKGNAISQIPREQVYNLIFSKPKEQIKSVPSEEVNSFDAINNSAIKSNNTQRISLNKVRLTSYKQHYKDFDSLLGLNSFNEKSKANFNNAMFSFPGLKNAQYINSKNEGFKLNANAQNSKINSSIIEYNIKANKNNSVSRDNNHINTNSDINLFKNNKDLPNSEYILAAPIFNSNAIFKIFKNETKVKIEFNFKQILGETDIQKFSEGGAYCNIEKNCYFTGGKDNGQTFLQISIINDNNNYIAHLIKMPSMIYSHFKHSITGNEKYLFVVGGYDSNKCEYFDMKTFKWNKMPELISNERQRPILVIHEDYLYAFMGFNKTDILYSIERINIKSLKTSKWENVITLNPIKLYGSGTYTNNKNVFFIGGKHAKGTKEEDYNKYIIIFDFEKNTFYKINDYYEGQFYFVENKFHEFNNDELGSFSYVNNGHLVTIDKSTLIE